MRPKTLNQFMEEIEPYYPHTIGRRIVAIITYLFTITLSDVAYARLNTELTILKNTNLEGSDYITESLWGPLNRYIVEIAGQYIKPKDCVFDIGCEQGIITAMIGHRKLSSKVIGIDICLNAINAAKKRRELPSCVEYIFGDFQKYQHKAEVLIAARLFNVVGGSSIGALPFLVNARRLLKDDGVLIACDHISNEAIPHWLSVFEQAGFKSIYTPIVKSMKQLNIPMNCVCFQLRGKPTKLK